MEREELLKSAKALYEYHFTSDKLKHELEDAFPELKESEDDRVRNRLITLIHVLDEIFFSGDNPSKEQCLAYLKRQKSVERSEKKYIDVDKLNTEINRVRQDWLGDSTGLEVGESGAELGAAESILDSIDGIIDSLQEEQPIDENTLTWKDINDLERIINNVHYEFRAGIGEKSFGEEVLERFKEERDE